MTKQELKLELAKVAIEHGLPLFDTTLFYKWKKHHLFKKKSLIICQYLN